MYCVLQYKFFGPHCGILYGRYDLLDDLFAYKVRPAPDSLPGRFETGTQNHEGLAGVLAAQNINLWDGNYYAISVTERLGLEESGGMVRVGPVQSNTLEEVGRLKEALRGLV